MNIDRFHTSINGKEVSLYRIFSNNISCYINADEQYHGATVGRYANRIANGKFSIDGTDFTLDLNNGPNSLHGGKEALHRKVWSVKESDGQKIMLECVSPHMEEGFPGELTVQVTYQIKGSDLVISYAAKSTENTIINLTHHSYFNLNGEGSGTVIDHLLKINSEYFTPIDQNTIPNGKLELVSGTPFDFSVEKKIGQDLDSGNEQLQRGYGYDHNFVVSNYVAGNLGYVASAKGDKSGLEMQVWSTEPGVQFYSANHLSGKDIGKMGVNYHAREAFCLETQHFPDSPNQSHFPSTLLVANEIFKSVTEYRFSLV